MTAPVPRSSGPWLADWDPAGTVRSGATVGFGGLGTSRKPLALAAALVAGGVRNLRVVSFLGSVEVELLLSAGCVAELHTAGVAVDGVGMAPLYRLARQTGDVRVLEWSEGSLFAALDAAARGLPSMPCGTSPASDVVRTNPHLRAVPDPFTSEPVVLARAMPLDVAFLHAAEADRAGNLFIDGDVGMDGLMACAAETVVATVEAPCARPPAEAAISRVWVDVLLERPGGARPTACYPRYPADLTALRAWVASRGASAAVLQPTGPDG